MRSEASFLGQLRSRLLGRPLCRGIILLFHEVHDEEAYLRELKHGCTVELLEGIVAGLQHKGWDFVDFDELIRRLTSAAPSRPFVALTFDDGYRNSLTNALPLLERHGVPFTVYVPSGAPTRALPAWWLGLRALFKERDTVEIAAMGRTFTYSDTDGRVQAHRAVTIWVHQDYRRADLLNDTFRTYGVSLADLNGDYFMSEDELRHLARSALVTIGAHTTSHPALTALAREDAREEMTDNRRYLEGLVNRPVLDFAYPFGIWGPREVKLAAEAGFRSAATEQEEAIFAGDRHHPHTLPRMSISGTSVALAYVMARIDKLSGAAPNG